MKQFITLLQHPERMSDVSCAVTLLSVYTFLALMFVWAI